MLDLVRSIAERISAEALSLHAAAMPYLIGRARREPVAPLSHRPLFDADWYGHRYPEVRRASAVPYDHYFDIGRHQGLRPNQAAAASLGILPRPPGRFRAFKTKLDIGVIADSGLFDVGWYAARYGVDLDDTLHHYVAVGAFAGLDPNPCFSSLTYYQANPDVAYAGANALSHYLRFGFRENRPGAEPDHLMKALLIDTVWRDGLCASSLPVAEDRVAFGEGRPGA